VALTDTEARQIIEVIAWLRGTRPYAHGAPVTVEDAGRALWNLGDAAATKLGHDLNPNDLAIAVDRIRRALTVLDALEAPTRVLNLRHAIEGG